MVTSIDTTVSRVFDSPQVNLTSEAYERPPFDAPYSLAISELQSDRKYLVAYRENVVKQIVKEGWNPIAAGSIKVNLRPDSTLWILDGPNRVEAAKRLNLSHLWAEVFHFKTVSEEAYWSRRWNVKMAALTALEKFRIGIEAADPDKLVINNLARKHGFRITSSRLIDYSLSAVTTLEKIYIAYGATTVDFILRVVVNSWSGEPESTVEDILKALLVLNTCYDANTLDEEDLIFRLSEHKAVWWRREAEADRGEEPLFIKLAARFLKAYNHYKHTGVKRGGKLEMFDLEEALSIL